MTQPIGSTGAATQGTGLLRVLGGAFGLAIVVGATIGGGILGTPGTVASSLPSTPLFLAAWVLGGVSALLGATVYAELGAMIPRSGGIYVFAHRAFGRGIGTCTGYVDWVNWSVSSAALILLVGQYLGEIIPQLADHGLIAGFLVFFLLVAVQFGGVRSGGRAQEITSVLKTVALLALVVAAFVLPHQAAAPVAAKPLLAHGTGLLIAFGVAMQGVIFSYDSYYAIVYCSEELRDPGRMIPRSIFRGLLVIIGIYLLINAAFLAVMPVSRMAGDLFVGGTVATLVLGAHGELVIRIIMIVAVLGTINAQIIAAPRILLAMSHDGLFPAQATRVNARGTPTGALVLSLALISGLLFLGSFGTVLAVDSFCIVLLYLVTYAALFVLRRREPDAPRPYRAWGYPFIPAIAFIIVLLLLVTMSIGDHQSALITLALVLVSLPASLLVQRFTRPSGR